MGEAKNRGTYSDRKAESIKRLKIEQEENDARLDEIYNERMNRLSMSTGIWFGVKGQHS